MEPFDSDLHDDGLGDVESLDPKLRQLFGYVRAHCPQEGSENRFGKYVIREELGNTGHSFIFRANDPFLNRVVVLKIPNPEARLDQDIIVEGRTLSDIDSPHVVKVLAIENDPDKPDQLPYLVLEDIQGKTLEDFACDRPLDESAVLDIAKQIALGLKEVHRLGILHLDLKPANVMIDRDGVVRIIDFGLARRQNEVSFDEIVGTPAYLAPERSSDQPEKISYSTDFFGLGGIMFYLLTGSAPFSGQTSDETIRNSMRGNTDLDKLKKCRASASTKRLVRSCLSLETGQRPQDSAEFLRRIRKMWLAKTGICILVLFFVLVAAFFVRQWIVSSMDASEPVVKTRSQVRNSGEDYLANFQYSSNGHMLERLGSRMSGTNPISSAEVFAEHSLRKNRRYKHSANSSYWLITQIQLKEHLAMALFLQNKTLEAYKIQENTKADIVFTWTNAKTLVHNNVKRASWFLEMDNLEPETRERLNSSLRRFCRARFLHWQHDFDQVDGALPCIRNHVTEIEELLGKSHPYSVRARAYELYFRLTDRMNRPLVNEEEVRMVGMELNQIFENPSLLEANIYFEFAKRKMEEGAKILDVETEDESNLENSQPLFNLSRLWFQKAIRCIDELHLQKTEQAANFRLRYGMLLFHYLRDVKESSNQFSVAYQIYDESAGFRSTAATRTVYYHARLSKQSGDYVTALRHVNHAYQIYLRQREVDRFHRKEWHGLSSMITKLRDELTSKVNANK